MFCSWLKIKNTSSRLSTFNKHRRKQWRLFLLSFESGNLTKLNFRTGPTPNQLPQYSRKEAYKPFIKSWTRNCGHVKMVPSPLLAWAISRNIGAITEAIFNNNKNSGYGEIISFQLRLFFKIPLLFLLLRDE